MEYGAAAPTLVSTASRKETETMPDSIPELRMPVRQHNPEGQPRRVGVELEMNGLTLDRLAQLVADAQRLTITSAGRYQRELHGDPAGDWQVELDFNLLKELGRETRDPDDFGDDFMISAEEALKWLAETLVPLEVVSPPLPMARLGEIEELIVLLREAGAKGTSEKATNAFGMQFNPEIPSADAETLTAYLKSFLCLYDWLYARADINITRRLTTYIDPFPIEYVRLVVDPDYWPDTATLIDDYLMWNPNRNRALDLLPLFLHLDPTRVRDATDDPLIKPRPAFHYRLPDCEIHKPDWGLHESWNDWIEVEALSADATRLQACCAAYANFLHQPLKRWLGDWAAEIEVRWLAR